MKPKVLVITGGHLNPALAFIEKIKPDPGWAIHYIGRKFDSEESIKPSLESKLIPDLDIPFHPINPARLQRRLTWAGLRSLSKFPGGLIQSHVLMKQIKPDAVLSFGGYVGFYVSAAAFISHVPVVIHEQTNSPGIANLASSLLAQKIAISWPQTKFLGRKTYLTGNLVRQEIFSPDPKITSKYKLNQSLPTILVVGGHQGSFTINQTITPKLTDYLQFSNVIFQTGALNLHGDYENALNKIKSSRAIGYCHVQKFFYPGEYGAVLNLADLVIGRSGANTVTDVAALGKPAIFIPLPWSGRGEQYANAKLLTDFGSQIIDQSRLTPEVLFTAVKNSLDNLHGLKSQSYLSKQLIHPHAAEELLKLISSLVK